MTIGTMPTPGALPVVVIYAMAAALARRAARRLRRDRHRPAGWRTIALILATLALFRLFDGEEHLTRIVAGRAWQAGWYHDRAPIQRIAVGVALTIGLLGVAMAAAAARRLGAALVAASVATALLLAIAALRVISLHATDHLLRVGWGPVTVSRAIEAGALAIVLVAAGMAARASARR